MASDKWGDGQDRLMQALLRTLSERLPQNTVIESYRSGTTCSVDFLNSMLDDVVNGKGQRVFFGTRTPTILPGEPPPVTQMEQDLLEVFVQRFPDNRSLKLYRRGIIAPTEAANCMLDEIGPQA